MSEQVSVWKNPPSGFRVMPWDPVAALLCALAVWRVWPQLGHWSLVMPFVLGNFFLFCNVFRVRRSHELVWAAVLLANCAGWLYLGPTLAGIVLAQLPVTVAVIWLEIRSPTYHGVGSAVRATTTTLAAPTRRATECVSSQGRPRSA